MVRDLRGRRVLITGASSGIGEALAEEAARLGARVVVTARSGNLLNDLANRLNRPGAEVVPVEADVTVDADRQRLLDVVAGRFDGLDVLINNAGVGASGHFADSSDVILRQVMEVNFFAPAELIRLAVPLLARGDQPAIVNVSSMCGRRGIPAWPEYSASKFALIGLTEAVRAELKTRYNVDVLLIVPGMTASNLNRNLLRSEARQKWDFAAGMPPDSVARVIVDALRHNRRETVIGRDARWILRVNHWFPWLVDRLLIRRVRQLWSTQAEVSVEA
jgi:short-subunit dehydrogenase